MEKVKVKFRPDVMFCPSCGNPMYFPGTGYETVTCIMDDCSGYRKVFNLPEIEVEEAQ